jgi:hypothetical protein
LLGAYKKGYTITFAISLCSILVPNSSMAYLHNNINVDFFY